MAPIASENLHYLDVSKLLFERDSERYGLRRCRGFHSVCLEILKLNKV